VKGNGLNLSRIIDRCALNFPDKTAPISDRIRYTYERLKFATEQAAFKASKKIVFVEGLPKSPAAKILNREIRQSFV
jgi:acyl-coenzyme A synthetase/AMP-(fatty) acid ligase